MITPLMTSAPRTEGSARPEGGREAPAPHSVLWRGGADRFDTVRTGGIARAVCPGGTIGLPRLNRPSIAGAPCPGARKRQAEEQK